jgi:uncharacterized membrane protein YhaH (DUF805 family)
MKRVLLLVVASVAVIFVNAQLLTWSPAFPKETDNITITVDATKGNQGLMGFAGNVYVHMRRLHGAQRKVQLWLLLQEQTNGRIQLITPAAFLTWLQARN